MLRDDFDKIDRGGPDGIFPDDASLIRLVSMLAIEANDEWLVGRGYISLQSMQPLLESGSIDPTPRRYSNSNRPKTPTTTPTTRAQMSYTTSWDLTESSSPFNRL